MPLSVGEALGPYEIVALVGKGGMGEVYRAHDSRLSRDVAIKVSNAQFTERFTREARTIASLNHTNICHLYDVGPNYLVMEYVEGPDLCGPMNFEDALPIIQQVIDGIEAAHEKSIIHRDLKPANIKITPEGVVKILDFGLAKAMEPPPSDDGKPENSPTMTMGATVAGTILGTAAYMAPEQAKGKTADKRSDIWSFGVIVYEMLTGKRLFQGESAVEILGGVLNQEPDISAAPGRVHKLLRWCLEKDRKKRLASISDARRLMEESELSESTAPAPSRLGKLPWIAAAALAVIALILSFVHFRETPPREQTMRSLIALPENSTLHSFAISPDGRTLVIAASINGKRQLWLRPIDALQAQPLPFTEDATYPFWSPDSRWIGFFAQNKLKKIAASGGPSRSLCEAPYSRGGTWNRDDIIVFSPANGDFALQRCAASGGVPTVVTRIKGDYRHPVFLPDGRHFLYLALGSLPETTGVYVSSLDGKENRRLLADESEVMFARPTRREDSGHILFVREGNLMAQPFDAGNAQVVGEEFLVAEGIRLPTNETYAPVSISDDGVLLYASGAGGDRIEQIVWYDRAGNLLSSVSAGMIRYPAISPDEKTVAFQRLSSVTASDLWLRDNRGSEARFTTDVSANSTPFWSPKGDRIVFASNRKGGVYNLYRKATNGNGNEKDELLLQTANAKFPSQWSRDGRFIVYTEADSKTKQNIWVLPVERSAAPRGSDATKAFPFVHTEFNEVFGQLSPDSRWMAYTSDESGHREVYVRPFPGAESKSNISVAGGQEPRWSGDGKEIFFKAADGKMMAARVRPIVGTKTPFQVDTPHALFDAHMARGARDVLYEYDVTPDGKRFLVLTTNGPGPPSAPPLTIVVNWRAGIKK